MIVHHQNPESGEVGLPPLRACRLGTRVALDRALVGKCRQPHDELAALPWPFAPRLHGAAVQFDEPLDESQADAESLARALAGGIDLHEHVEDAAEHLCGNTDAGVADRDHGL